MHTDLPKHAESHLILHLDINETVLIGDEAGGDTNEDCLNKMLAKSAFVRMPGKGGHFSYEHTSSIEPTHWWDGSPILERYPSHAKPPPLHTDWEWPAGCCPYYRTKFKKRSKTFVSHHGSIYKELHDQLERKTKFDVADNNVFQECPVLSHMIPALFETLIALSESSQPHTIVLRTMGSDLPDVAKAINLFANGQHPAYPDFCNEDYLIGPEHLVQGRWAEKKDDNEEKGSHVYQLWRDEEILASGDVDVLEFLHTNRICGIQDDYPFWKKHHHEPWAGKPVWIPSDRYCHHLLFDDNIHNLENDSIASIRRQEPDGSFATLSSHDILQQHGVHLIRVPTVEPILNPHWFLQMISKAQARYSQ